MSFAAIFITANSIHECIGLHASFDAVLVPSIYVVLGAALTYTWKKTSLPALFVGSAALLVLIYFLFMLSTAPQMNAKRWMHNYGGDVPSFGQQFLSALEVPILFTRGLSAAFLLCNSVAEVRCFPALLLLHRIIAFS